MINGRLSLGTLVSAALLASCSGAGTSLAPQAPLGVAPSSTKAMGSAHSRFNNAGSWVSPNAASGDLLYVSDARGSVYMYTYPAGKLVGLIRGFHSPAGLCSDAKGNVFVVNTNDLDVLEFKHGGTKSIQELNDFGHYPVGCAVDPKSGDVAVANYASTLSLGPGSVSIFHGGHGIPSSYQNQAFNAFFFCGYDDKGNLFVDGADYGSYNTKFAELSYGSSNLNNVTLDQTIGYPGGVMWDGKYLAVQDTYTRRVYRFKMAGSKGTSIGSVNFKGNNTGLLTQFWLDGSSILMPFGTLPRAVRKVGYWPYPKGGPVSQSYGVKNSDELVGITISLATK
ncbi:MAG TPA: hypothetical protein VHR97_05040 [Candidatus Baltobacteraceae bacterium]|nr:hypothetical protein [Candidatus Baltobacteraceae bacterium]